ncbi:MAG TPA: hypothetical protein VHO69_11005, partial [Phototrophicaceae bacterium]|nr:hypothetical protein [Phototrophicaceae bacterium]
APSTLSQGIPYLITIGEDHPQAELSKTYARELQDRGITVGLQILPSDGQMLALEQVELAVHFTREIFTGS